MYCSDIACFGYRFNDYLALFDQHSANGDSGGPATKERSPAVVKFHPYHLSRVANIHMRSLDPTKRSMVSFTLYNVPCDILIIFTPQLSVQQSQALHCHYQLSTVTTSSPLSLTATTNYCFTPQLSGQQLQALRCHYQLPQTTASPLNSVGSSHKLSAVTNSYHKLLLHPSTQWVAVTSSPLSLTATTNYCFTPQLSGQQLQALCCH